jgi:ADP-heptose:LPS heptosyltransferase
MEQGAEPMKPVPRVLVIRGGAIGDFILTLPAIRLIRQNIPGCHLEVLGYPGIVDLAVKAGLAEGVRSLEHRSMALLFAKEAVIEEALVEYLCGFNLIVSYLYDPDGLFRASLERIGVKTLIECPHRVEPEKGHASLQLARPLEKLAMFLEEERWREPFFLDEAELKTKMLRVAIHPGSGSEKKNWPVENWLRLGREMADRFPGIQIALITGEAEEARGVTERFRVAWGVVPHERWEGLPLTELAERMTTCDLFWGHDSGIAHLAAACGVPCGLLFGPTDPALWAPPQERVQVLQAPEGDLASLSYETVWENFTAAVDMRREQAKRATAGL